MICIICGKENSNKHQSFCKNLGCSGKMVINNKYKINIHMVINNKYKINIHAHSYFSDGANSPYVMALKAKELGFTALVITDHFYGRREDVGLNLEKFELLRKACKEAREILPVILGLEVPVGGNEVLVFGGAIINKLLADGIPELPEFIALKKVSNTGIILCHPSNHFNNLIPLIDGFEQYNSGNNWFKHRKFGKLSELPRWDNSDAHSADQLHEGWNVIDSKITNEADLIKYIKRRKYPELSNQIFLKGE
jgi:predicted metal-dependent phosphoesterase TrpH